MFKGKITALLN